MLQANMEAWRENWKNARKLEWIQEGRQEGQQAGEATFLLRLLQRRFGTLPEGVVRKVRAADPSVLEMWGDRVLDAQTLEEVLADRM